MASLGLLILTVLILFVTLLFYVGIILNFIRPSAIQIQVLGVHISLFGVTVVLAFNGYAGFGFFIGLIGLVTGVFGSFWRTPN
jgi:hypothetical protein